MVFNRMTKPTFEKLDAIQQGCVLRYLVAHRRQGDKVLCLCFGISHRVKTASVESFQEVLREHGRLTTEPLRNILDLNCSHICYQ